ncbi:MAG TPA: hypothetical protein VKH37_05370, partial [Ferruginibacter sp.]|nr:hypothetical protein [Ferruginibacter sp.]
MFIKRIFTLVVGFTLIALQTLAQSQPDYKKNWKKVQALEDKGLPKSALAEVMNIYKMATKDNNEPQVIKTYIYQIKYRSQIEEDNQEKNIAFVDSLIQKTKAPAKNVLQSIQADMYWNYLEDNRWKFNERTRLADDRSKDIATWSIDKLFATITQLYNSSLSNTSLLKSTAVGYFDAILIKGENTRQLRPTLYDLLAHRALYYFMSNETGSALPSYEFKIKDKVVFGSAHEFINASFPGKDSLAPHRHALMLLADLTKFHINDPSPDALIDLDLMRFSFA